MTFATIARSATVALYRVSPRALVDRLFEAFNRHDTAALQSLYRPDAVLTASDFCEPRTGRDVARTYAALFSEFPDIRDQVVTVLIQGDRAAVRFVSSSHIEGKAFHVELMTLLRFKLDCAANAPRMFQTCSPRCPLRASFPGT
jgi:hypothetical protein